MLNAHESDYSHYSKKIEIHYLFEFVVIMKFVLPSHHSQIHFPYKNLVIAQMGRLLLLCLYFV